MDARRKTLIRLSEDAREGFARVAAKGSFNKFNKGAFKPPFGGDPDEANPFAGRAPGTPTKRDIPPDHEFNKAAIKPIVKTLWAMSVALGHALTAHRSFSRLKSSTFSPDGLLGGRGYVLPVKDIRADLFEACEKLSALCDTLHDEINAPHWKPKIAELEKADMDEVERLLGDSEDWIDNPEEEADEELEEVEKKPFSKAKKRRFEKENDNFRSKLPTGGDPETVPSQGPHPAEPDHPFNRQNKQASVAGGKDLSSVVSYSYGRFPPEAFGPNATPGLYRAATVNELAIQLDASLKGDLDWHDQVVLSYERQPIANSSLAPQTEPGGPRVQHLDRADTDQDGPEGSYNRDEKPVSDQWGEEGGVSGEPMSDNSGDSYSYPSDWSGNLSGKSAGSGLPSDSTPTQGWDFGIGDGDGNDAHGQGAGGYGEGNPGSPGNKGDRGVYGPRAERPNDPGGKTKDNEESDSNPSIERSVSESGHMGLPVTASRYAAVPDQDGTLLPIGSTELPNDEDEPAARSDYYFGPKGNDFGGVHRWGQAELPGGGTPQPKAPLKPRPSHLGEHEFSAAGELPGDETSDLYDYGAGGGGGNVMDRVEQGNQPYTKWDDTTHNMRPDYNYQRDPVQGPYPH